MKSDTTFEDIVCERSLFERGAEGADGALPLPFERENGNAVRGGFRDSRVEKVTVDDGTKTDTSGGRHRRGPVTQVKRKHVLAGDCVAKQATRIDTGQVDKARTLGECNDVLEETVERYVSLNEDQKRYRTHGSLMGFGPYVPSTSHENRVKRISASTPEVISTHLIDNQLGDIWDIA